MNAIVHTKNGEYEEYGAGISFYHLHRTDGPAVEWEDGDKEWFVDGKRHRIDGPAVIFADGRPGIWYVNDNQLSRIEVEKWIEENNIDLSTKEGQIAFKMRWS